MDISEKNLRKAAADYMNHMRDVGASEDRNRQYENAIFERAMEFVFLDGDIWEELRILEEKREEHQARMQKEARRREYEKEFGPIREAKQC